MTSQDSLPDEIAPASGHLLAFIDRIGDGLILVDAGGRITWANQAAARIHGGAHVDELGSSAVEYRKRFELRYRNNHPLTPEQYPLDRLAAGEAFEDVVIELRRIGNSDERWVCSATGLLATENGGRHDTRALILRDMTAYFDAQERFERAFRANPAPALICKLSDLRFIRANPGFLELTAYTLEQVLARDLDRLDVLTGAERRDLALDRLKEGRVIPQMEATIPLPDGREKAVIVAGQPIVIEDEACMLFTFADLDPRNQAESAYRQTAELFSRSFHLSPAPAAICKLDGFAFVDVNEAFAMISGRTVAETVGRRMAELHLWADRAARQQFEEDIRKGAVLRGKDMTFRSADGSLVDCLISATRVNIDGTPHVLWVLQDITDRKRSEEELMEAIEAVMADTSWFSHSVVEKLASIRRTGSTHSRDAELRELTERERDVLHLICLGMSNAEMSHELNLSPNTVRNHVSSLYQKIGVSRRSAAVIWGRERGISGHAKADENRCR